MQGGGYIARVPIPIVVQGAELAIGETETLRRGGFEPVPRCFRVRLDSKSMQQQSPDVDLRRGIAAFGEGLENVQGEGIAMTL